MRTFFAASAALYMALVNLAPTALADDYLNETVETRGEIIEFVESAQPLASRKEVADARKLSRTRAKRLPAVRKFVAYASLMRRAKASASLSERDAELLHADRTTVSAAADALAGLSTDLAALDGLGANAATARDFEVEALRAVSDPEFSERARTAVRGSGLAPLADPAAELLAAAATVLEAQNRDQRTMARETQAKLVRSVRARRILDLSWLSNMGFHLRKEFGDDADAKGANLRYFSNFTAGDDELSFTGALSFDTARIAARRRSNRRKVLAWDADVGIGGNITSGDPGEQHYWEVRGGAKLRLWISGDRGDRVSRKSHIHYFSLSGRYVESQDEKIKDTTVNLNWVPKIGQIALGVRRGHETVNPKLVGPEWKDRWGVRGSGLNENGCCCTATNAFSWQWNLQVDVDVGEGDTPASALENNGDIFRPHAAVSARLYFDGFGRWLGKGRDATEYPFLEIRYGAYYFPLEGDQYRELFEVGAKFPLSKTFSVEATYHNGTAFPVFTHTETLELALGIRF